MQCLLKKIMYLLKYKRIPFCISDQLNLYEILLYSFDSQENQYLLSVFSSILIFKSFQYETKTSVASDFVNACWKLNSFSLNIAQAWDFNTPKIYFSKGWYSSVIDTGTKTSLILYF